MEELLTEISQGDRTDVSEGDGLRGHVVGNQDKEYDKRTYNNCTQHSEESTPCLDLVVAIRLNV